MPHVRAVELGGPVNFGSLAAAMAAARAASHLAPHPWLEMATRAQQQGDVELEQLCIACHDVVVLVEALIARNEKSEGETHETDPGP